MKIWSYVRVCHLFTLCEGIVLASPNTRTVATVGEQIMFCVNLHEEDNNIVELASTPDISIAKWTVNTSVKPEFIQPMYEGRVRWNMNGSLMLDNVQISDSKIYTITISLLNIDTYDAQKHVFDLSVFERITQLAANIISDCSSLNIILNCSVSSGTNVTFLWRKKSIHGASDGTYSGSNLVINRSIEAEQHVYICQAKNAVSNATSDAVTPNICHKGNLLWMISIGLIAVVLIAVLFISIKAVGRETRERIEPTDVFTDELIEPTYITSLNPAGMPNHSAEEYVYERQ
ncbi:uncharacterized protein LOC129703797 [Leucoraja erinacea]|uniref:uncharacterized protein LOC129703797 n=1 Tax=Leucoraja erinaceus TaxID=7782 RepID=UPI00245551FE|nr:uncharacterized protein LOC129703797 [Leucoraja erinacea]